MAKTTKFFVDPMCAWCWAQKPTIDKIMNDLDGKAGIEFYMGGMRVRENTKKIEGNYKAYLAQVFDRVNILSGQSMNKKVLDTEGLYFDSEYPCRAVLLIKRQLGKDQAIRYLHKIQAAYFVDAKNITQPSVLMELAGDGFVEDMQGFKEALMSSENEQYTFEEFDYVQQHSVSGFPTIQFLEDDTVVGEIPGFVDYQDAKGMVEDFTA